jgi:N-hydroxyarylamine O-acetyltransferase
MSVEIDLAAYKGRIGLEIDFRPDLKTLQAIMMAHVTTVPFENLDVLLNRPILLDAASLEHKLVHRQHGGYCFEHSGFLLLVLEQIGFEVKPLAARGRIGNPRGIITPRTHLFLKVTIDRVDWLTDVGCGGLSLSAPIRFDLDIEQETPHETRRIDREGDRSYHQALLGEVWTDIYEFTGEEMPEIDRETGNWWTSTSPKARFTQNLMVAKANPDGTRFAILNDRLTHRRGSEVLSETTIKSPTHLHELLAHHFNLTGDTPQQLTPCFGLGKG